MKFLLAFLPLILVIWIGSWIAYRLDHRAVRLHSDYRRSGRFYKPQSKG